MIPCVHRPPCPGCPRYGDTDIPRTSRDALSSLRREVGLPELSVVRGSPLGFRHRARLAVRGRMSSPKIGIFEVGTHRVVDIPRCSIHHPLVNEIAGEVRRAMPAAGVPPYSDTAHRGLVRYLQITVERRTQTAQLVVVANDSSPDACAPLFSLLAERLGPRLNGLFWNGNPERTNTILGPAFHRVLGAEATEESIGGARVFYPPGAFGQSHLDLADSIVDRVHSWVPDGARVLELYAGTGATGLGLVPRAGSVVFNEIAPGSLQGLDMGLSALPDELRGRCQVIAGPAASAAASIAEADVVIADPPRKGLEPSVRQALVRSAPQRFVYVACGLVAFLDDARALLSESPLALKELTVFDLFPFTEHVEVAAMFERR